MAPSVGSSQLPLSAFFTSSTATRKQSSKISLAIKRKEPPLGGKHVESPKKKRKQKENLTLTSTAGVNSDGDCKPLANDVVRMADRTSDDGRHPHKSPQIDEVEQPPGLTYPHYLPEAQRRNTQPLARTPELTTRNWVPGEVQPLPTPPPTVSSAKQTWGTRGSDLECQERTPPLGHQAHDLLDGHDGELQVVLTCDFH